MLGKQVKKKSMLDWVLAKLKIADFEQFLFGVKNYALSVSLWYFLIISLILVLIVKMRVLRE